MGKRATAGVVIEGKYRLERELGAGGMGAVWLATQLMVDRPVAIKLLHPAFVDQEDLQARFEVEAKAIGRLNHPNVITLYDFGHCDDLDAFYTVIEFIDGVSLDKRLNERIPLTEVVAVIRQVALALDHAHHHSILHRDLKPENVMLSRMTDGSEMVKVLDFGIARIVKGSNDAPQHESQRITKAGEVFGTPAYMSPEQARSIRQLEPSADLYSLGVMFYELVAGALPFFAHSAFDLLMLHVTKPVPPIRREGVPRELAQIIYRLLEKEPEKRFQTGLQLVKALDKLDLPEEALPEDEEFQSEPTIVQALPTPTLGVESPGLQEESTPADQLMLPTPPTGPVAPAVDGDRSTLMMHGGGTTAQQEPFDTMPPKRRRNIGPIVLTVVLLFALGAGALFVSRSSPPETLTVDSATATPSKEEIPEETPPEEKVVAEAGADTIAPPTDEKPPELLELPAEEKPEEPAVQAKPAPEPKPKPKRKKRSRKARKKARAKEVDVVKPRSHRRIHTDEPAPVPRLRTE